MALIQMSLKSVSHCHALAVSAHVSAAAEATVCWAAWSVSRDMEWRPCNIAWRIQDNQCRSWFLMPSGDGQTWLSDSRQNCISVHSNGDPSVWSVPLMWSPIIEWPSSSWLPGAGTVESHFNKINFDGGSLVAGMGVASVQVWDLKFGHFR